MPKVLARDPPWLARPSPGFQLFRPDTKSTARTADSHYDGPSRKIAHRGTEVFVAVGNELRWSELGKLKDAGEEYTRRHGQYEAEDGEEVERAYRVTS